MACLREDRFEVTVIILTKNLCPSLHCLLLSSTDNYVVPLTFCTPFPFSDPLAPEYPVHPMRYFQDGCKETEAVVSCNLLLCSHLLLPIGEGFVAPHAWFPCVYSCLPDPSHSQTKSLKLSKPLNFLLDFLFCHFHELVQLLLGLFK